MESHVLNSYHQARYRPIGHKVMRAKSDSVSSESSSIQTSPDYNRISATQRIVYTQSEESNGEEWCRNKTMNTTKTNQCTSSDNDSSQEDLEDSEENIIVQEVNIDDLDDEDVDLNIDPVISNSVRNMQLAEGNVDDTLVEGHDYEIITVYTVNPDIDLIEASSEDEAEPPDNSFPNSEHIRDTESLTVDDSPPVYRNNIPEPKPNIRKQVMDILSAPVESNVDDYFIKNELLDSDEPVVKDVDEYFIKEVKPNVNDLHIIEKVDEKQSVPHVPDNSTHNVEESLIKDEVKKEPLVTKHQKTQNEDTADDPVNESDLEILPNIEDIKRFLLDDMPYTKFKNLQRSCSLPQSPIQNVGLDVDDGRTCLSFEDLNLDLSDLNFDNDKDKSDTTNKSDDGHDTLTDEDINSFLIRTKDMLKDDDLSQQDMEIEQSLETVIHASPNKTVTSTPMAKASTILNFCKEKINMKKEDLKADDDFVDVESCNDTVIPVLEANNLSSLLEQFEATEKLNTKKKTLKIEEKTCKNSLTNGMRLQDAGVQLNKNKMRQILMPTTIKTAVRSPSPVHSDHDYCSSKKRHSVPNLKSGQSLLKPEVLSNNSRILKSRHRSCKNKKVVYHLSSDDENETIRKKKVNGRSVDDEIKKKVIKQPTKATVQSNCRKKLSPPHQSDINDKDNSSVMFKSACKASDTPCSRNSGSIKLTIKNKSEVILNNCDFSDSQKDKNLEKCKPSVSDSVPIVNIKQDKKINDLDKSNDRSKIKTVNIENGISVKQEPRPSDEHFYTALFSNKKDVHIPTLLPVKNVKRPFDDELNRITIETMKKDLEQPQKKKKLNLMEYKMRRGANSNQSSTTVSPEAIFPDMPLSLDKITKRSPSQISPNTTIITDNKINDAPKKIFDPIREASRKILMNYKKQKAEAMRKRDEDIVMSKIPKVENLELQPLISDAEMMKIVGMTAPILPTPVTEKPQISTNFEESILVSVGVNTDNVTFKRLKSDRKMEPERKSTTPTTTPPLDEKTLINFKIRISDHVLKQNVFDNVKRDKKSPIDDKKNSETKIDKERFKGITATLKSVEKQVDTISSNSLFASIQDVVMKKAPDEGHKNDNKSSKVKSPGSKLPNNNYLKIINNYKYTPVTIIREYDSKMEHGEDKVILHLSKDREKPASSNISIQTDYTAEYPKLNLLSFFEDKTLRKRNDSDMSISRETSPLVNKKVAKVEEKTLSSTKPNKVKEVVRPEKSRKRSLSRGRRSRSRDRKYRHRSRSRSLRRRRSRTRSISRSRGRFRSYRRSDSPYKRKRRSRSHRRSPSIRKNYRSKQSRTRSRSIEPKPKSPVKKRPNTTSPVECDKKPNVSFTPPLRKMTVSESSDSSTSSSSTSSSSSSSSSESSAKSRQSVSSYKKEESFKNTYRSFSSEDRESNTPVEERRIVFVGKLEKDITKLGLRSQFTKFGPVIEVRLHSKEDGTRYGFVTYKRARDAWSAVEAANTFPQYDVGFGGRRAFCRQSYADLDGLEAKYTESAFHGQSALPARRADDMSFEQMLLEMKKKLSQRKSEKKRPNEDNP